MGHGLTRHGQVHAVLWQLALGACAGFQSVPETLRMAGRNYGLQVCGWCCTSWCRCRWRECRVRPLKHITVKRWGMQR